MNRDHDTLGIRLGDFTNDSDLSVLEYGDLLVVVGPKGSPLCQCNEDDPPHHRKAIKVNTVTLSGLVNIDIVDVALDPELLLAGKATELATTSLTSIGIADLQAGIAAGWYVLVERA